MNEERLQYFKRKLEEKRGSLTDLVQRTEQHGRESDLQAPDVADLAVALYTREFMFGKSSQDHRVLLMIDEALLRIEDSSYGVCANCEEEIQHKRLEALPWARNCVRCQWKLERSVPSEIPRLSLAADL
jgi:DnaK suppressor protein